MDRYYWDSTGLIPAIKSKGKLDFETIFSCLHRLAIEQGDCLFIHHSYGKLQLDFNPVRLIHALQEKVGANGNIIMLATPFYGRSIDYLKSDPLFDLNGPCQIGMISEMFRRLPNVHRSIHPLSSACVWGKNAQTIANQHQNLEYAYNEDSVYGYGDRINAKIIGFGVGVRSLSPMHYYEYLQKDKYAIYTAEKYNVRIKDKDKNIREMSTYTLNPRTMRRWEDLQKALNRNPEYLHFTLKGREFYSVKFHVLKLVIESLMGQNLYFKAI